MRWIRFAVALCAAMPIGAAVAQTSATVVLDAAHGGSDVGGRFANRVPEKDVNAQIAIRLQSLLQARGLTVKMLRDGDPSPTPTADQRAGSANQAHALACIVVHSTPTGSGVHLYTSTLHAAAPSSLDATAPLILRWNEAQRPYVTRSAALAGKLAEALNRSHTQVTVGKTWTVPIDSMQCPAVVIEVAPTDSEKTQPTDGGFQQRVAEAVAAVLLQWRDAQPAPAVKQ